MPGWAATRIMSRMMKAMRGSITDRGMEGGRWYTVRPCASSIRVTRRGSTTLPRFAHTVYAAT